MRQESPTVARKDAPAKMKDTGFVGDKDLKKSKRVSTRGGDLPGTAADWHWGWGYRGMGGVVSTVHDLYLWDRALRGEKVLDAETKAITEFIVVIIPKP